MPLCFIGDEMKGKFIKIFSVALLSFLILAPLFVSAEVNPAEPTAKLYLSEPKLQERSGKSYITVDVLIDDNTADLFVVSYRVMSKDKLVPVNFDNGSFSETVVNAFGDEKLTLNATDTLNPSAITSKNLTGIHVLQDSASGTKGISTKSGVLGTAWFEAPAEDGIYTFVIENLGCNNVYSEGGKLNVGTYKVDLGKDVSFVVGEAKQSTQMTEICDEHNFTVEVEDGKKCDSCDTVRRDDGSIRYPAITVTDGNTSQGNTQQSEKADNDTENEALFKYILPLLIAVVVASAIVVAVILINRRKK